MRVPEGLGTSQTLAEEESVAERDVFAVRPDNQVNSFQLCK